MVACEPQIVLLVRFCSDPLEVECRGLELGADRVDEPDDCRR